MKNSTRNSAIEALKVFGIGLIVISHVVQTLGRMTDLTTFHNAQFTVLSVFRQFGSLGNAIFFVCSAWFLLQSSSCNGKKWFSVLTEVWTVSVLILIITFVLLKGAVEGADIMKSLFPTFFANNWYLTCYLLFYPVHPLLNRFIRNLEEKTFFRLTLAMVCVYYGFSFIRNGSFFYSDLMLWIVIYFVVAHIQKRNVSRKGNALLLITGILGLVGIPVAAALAGHYISALDNMMLFGNKNNNPFCLMIAVSLFHYAKNSQLRSRVINYISGLSLLIYIIHENIILRTYFRPAIVQRIYESSAPSRLLPHMLALSFGIFVFSLVCASVYSCTVKKAVTKVSDAVFQFLRKQYLLLESRLFPADTK